MNCATKYRNIHDELFKKGYERCVYASNSRWGYSLNILFSALGQASSTSTTTCYASVGSKKWKNSRGMTQTILQGIIASSSTE